ncbi:MAG: hypothetical protein GF344_04845 [Chitinivibrionales bacterium]|nr:hypothetical protein [Chitinivibrionales bacterium]
MWQAWVNIAAGIWAVISGFSMTLVNPTNFLITGAVMAVFGFWAPRRRWQGIVNGVIGLWLIISAFIAGLVTPQNLIISGLVVAVLAGWRVAETRTKHHPPQPAR